MAICDMCFEKKKKKYKVLQYIIPEMEADVEEGFRKDPVRKLRK